MRVESFGDSRVRNSRLVGLCGMICGFYDFVAKSEICCLIYGLSGSGFLVLISIGIMFVKLSSSV